MKGQKLKNALRLAVCAVALGIAAGWSLAAQSQQPSYRTVTEVYDWGPAVSKVVVNLGRAVAGGDVSAQNFSVHVRRELAEGATTDSPENLEGDRAVINAYASDADGNEQDGGGYVTLEFAVSPTDNLGAALNYSASRNTPVISRYTITAGSTVIDNCQGDIRPQVDKFTFARQSVGGGVSYSYASYEPQDEESHPLIIWLHGGGEGGGIPSVPLMANKAVAFADESVQRYFGGAYVLVPQSPTAWMQGFEGLADGTSIYSESLMRLIKDYVASHPGVDENRIYVGGASNGGYMTLLLIRDNPGYFAAAFPTCEGLRDDIISPSDLRSIAKTPTWFTAARTDAVLPPVDYSVPTVARLKRIQGADVHFSFFDNVVDTTGQYKQEDGSPYEYNGHWSWIYVYNDECEEVSNGQTLKLFAWMASKTRQ